MTYGMMKKRVGQQYKKCQWQWRNRVSIKIVLFSTANDKDPTMERKVHKKKICKGFPMFFVIPDFRPSKSLF
jgi:hypothetical protein